MHKTLLILFLVVAGISGLEAPLIAAETNLATKPEFVESWIVALREAGSTLEIEIVDELEISAKEGELTIRASAEQAYESYLAEPDTQGEQIAILVRMVNEALQAAQAAPDMSRIVPVIKTSDWLAKYRLDCPYYPLPDDLIVVLAEDRTDEIRYLRTSDLNRLEKSIPELFTIAIGNLRRVAPVEEHDAGDFIMLSSGGNYEAGLMLDSALIASYEQRFAGEIVFSVPFPDVFILTGRDDQQGLGGIVRAVCASVDPSTRLSSKVFAARQGALEVAGEVDCNGELPVITMD